MEGGILYGSHQPLTPETPVESQASPCGNYGGKSGNRRGFSPESSV